jgi:hypothetical protein
LSGSVKIKAAVRVANHIVGAVETPAHVVVYQAFHSAIRTHAGDAPVVALAHDQTALQVKGRAVSADRGPDNFGGFPRCHAKQLVLTDIDKIPVAVGVPQRPFRENKAGGETLGLCGLKNVGQIVGCRHHALLALRDFEGRNATSSSLRQVGRDYRAARAGDLTMDRGSMARWFLASCDGSALPSESRASSRHGGPVGMIRQPRPLACKVIQSKGADHNVRCSGSPLVYRGGHHPPRRPPAVAYAHAWEGDR